MILVGLAFVAACKQQASKPLAEDILGEWEKLCATDKEIAATCPGKADDGLYKVFHPGGKLVSGARRGSAMTGTWTLTGDTLVLAFDGISPDTYRARIEGDKLVLWYESRGFGSVLGRVGTPFQPAASKSSTAGRTSHEIGGIGYELTLPAGYRLTRDDNRRQRWAPTSGAGLVVALSVSERSKTQIDGKWVTPPCNDYDYGGVSSSSQTIAGVQRDTSVGISICLGGKEQAIMCSVEHSRGHLEDSEKDEALALCASLKVR